MVANHPDKNWSIWFEALSHWNSQFTDKDNRICNTNFICGIFQSIAGNREMLLLLITNKILWQSVSRPQPIEIHRQNTVAHGNQFGYALKLPREDIQRENECEIKTERIGHSRTRLLSYIIWHFEKHQHWKWKDAHGTAPQFSQNTGKNVRYPAPVSTRWRHFHHKERSSIFGATSEFSSRSLVFFYCTY